MIRPRLHFYRRSPNIYFNSFLQNCKQKPSDFAKFSQKISKNLKKSQKNFKIYHRSDFSMMQLRFKMRRPADPHNLSTKRIHKPKGQNLRDRARRAGTRYHRVFETYLGIACVKATEFWKACASRKKTHSGKNTSRRTAGTAAAPRWRSGKMNRPQKSISASPAETRENALRAQ